MLQQLNVLPEVRGLKLNTVFEVWLHQVPSTRARSSPCSCWPHYSWYKPGCLWPSWPPGDTAGSCSADCRPTPQVLFPPGSFPATHPQTVALHGIVVTEVQGPARERNQSLERVLRKSFKSFKQSFKFTKKPVLSKLKIDCEIIHSLNKPILEIII